MAAAKKLTIYPALSVGTGMAPAAILTTLIEKVLSGETGDPVSISTLQGFLNESRGSILRAFEELVENGRVNSPPEGGWADFDSFTIKGFNVALEPMQKALDLSDSPENRGWDTAMVNDLQFKVTVSPDVEDRAKQKVFLNVWLIDDAGANVKPVIRAALHDSDWAAWSFWRDWVRYLGWPSPATKWASLLPADRTYQDAYAATQQLIYVSSTLADRLIEEAKMEATLTMVDPALVFADETTAEGRRVTFLDSARTYAVAFMGHDLPDRLRPSAAEEEEPGIQLFEIDGKEWTFEVEKFPVTDSDGQVHELFRLFGRPTKAKRWVVKDAEHDTCAAAWEAAREYVRVANLPPEEKGDEFPEDDQSAGGA